MLNTAKPGNRDLTGIKAAIKMLVQKHLKSEQKLHLEHFTRNTTDHFSTLPVGVMDEATQINNAQNTNFGKAK